jgi:hypothetical protein
MTNATDLRHDGDDPEGLPFCSDTCPACLAEAEAATKRAAELEALHQPGLPCQFHPTVLLARSYHGHIYCDACEAEISRQEQDAEMGYERYLESRWDEEAQRDLAYHESLWPTYYGCPDDPGASL